MNTHYKENLKAVMQVSKKYTDDKIEQALELLEDYELSSETISQTSQTATAPSDVRTSSLIEVGGNCVKYAPSEASNKNVAYKKSIPNNTYKFFVDKSCGMSDKSENLIVLNDVAETTTNGITYKVENGGVTLNGTTTSITTIILQYPISLSAGTYTWALFNASTCYNSSLSPLDDNLRLEFRSGGAPIVASQVFFDSVNKTKTLTTTSIADAIYIRMSSGLTITNFTFKPMLVLGSTAPTEFKVGFSGIRNSAVSQLTIKSGNLANVQNNSVTDKGINYVASNETQSLKLNGTSTGGSYKNFDITTIPAGTYYVTVLISGTVSTSCNLYLMSPDVQSGAQIGTTANPLSNQQVTFSTDVKYLRVNVTASGVSFNNLEIKVMISKYSIVEYKPYVTPIIKTIPSEIQALTGYGMGFNATSNNYLDYDYKKFVKPDNLIDLGTLNWLITNHCFYATISDKKAISELLLISNGYTELAGRYYASTLWASSNDRVICCDFSTSSKIVIIKDTSLPEDASAFKAAMSGVYLLYELETPTETDVSQYLTDFNPIETNDLYGEIEFVNTYNQDMPNEISFVGTIKETLVTSFTIGSETTNITDSIESDGWSVSNSIYNYRKTRDKERHKVVGRVKAKDLNWQYNGVRFTVNISGKAFGNFNLISTNYATTMATDVVNMNDMEIKGNSSSEAVYIKDSNYDDTTTFKNHFTDNDYIYFELATPEVTPLDVDNDFHYIDLESGETITFNNANNQACHNTIRYSIMEEKV